MTDRDWFAILKREVEDTPPRRAPSADEVETLITDIVSGRVQPPKTREPRQWRRRWLAGGTVVVVLAGGATAAALWNRTKPEQPQQGIACHASLEIIGGAQVIPPAPDPLKACAQLWLAGVLPDIKNGGPPTDVAPPQFACVGPAGALEVFPNLSDPPTSCAELGLVEADTNVSTDPLVLLQDRLTNEINLVCVDVDAAKKLIEAALTDAGLDDWTVTVRENTNGCVLAGEDPETKSVYLLTNPTQTTTTRSPP
jgi:hypothetical protein